MGGIALKPSLDWPISRLVFTIQIANRQVRTRPLATCCYIRSEGRRRFLGMGQISSIAGGLLHFAH
jgi:hypothetical protein